MYNIMMMMTMMTMITTIIIMIYVVRAGLRLGDVVLRFVRIFFFLLTGPLDADLGQR